MPRVLFLTKYTSQAASSRLRMIQYFPMLEQKGIECTLSPLFDSAYLKQRYTGRLGGVREALQAFPHRIKTVLQSGRWDAVVLQYDLLPYLPEFLELFLRARGIPYVYDYDDAIFHYYDLHRRFAVRALLGTKIRNIIRGARSVLAGSPYLVKYAREANQNVEWAPTCVNIARFPVKDWEHSSQEAFTIGWIGSPSTAEFAIEAMPAIRQLAKIVKVRLVFVGSGPVRYEELHPEIREWSEETEIEQMLQFDVGIMPLPDKPWTRGKCAFKLIQYMACGLPVVASPVGMNCDVVAGGSGFLASSTEEWYCALERLAFQKEMRREMGRVGRARVERDFTTQTGGQKLLGAIRNALS